MIIKAALLLDIYSRGKKVFSISPDSLKGVALMSGLRYELPTILRSLFSQKVELKFVVLELEMGEVTLSAQDSGFDEALVWLDQKGWKLESSIMRSLELPYVRVPVVNTDGKNDA